MLYYKGGDQVKKGTYWNMATGERIEVAGRGILAANGSRGYLKIPSVLVLLAAPFLGLVYVIFLPVVGIGMVAVLLVRKIWSEMVGLLGRLAYFEWRPSESYLGGADKNKKESETRPKGPDGPDA